MGRNCHHCTAKQKTLLIVAPLSFDIVKDYNFQFIFVPRIFQFAILAKSLQNRYGKKSFQNLVYPTYVYYA